MSQPNTTPPECEICSAPTFNSYYGVKVCEPCEVFFKQNAENSTVSSNKKEIFCPLLNYLGNIKM